MIMKMCPRAEALQADHLGRIQAANDRDDKFGKDCKGPDRMNYSKEYRRQYAKAMTAHMSRCKGCST